MKEDVINDGIYNRFGHRRFHPSSLFSLVETEPAETTLIPTPIVDIAGSIVATPIAEVGTQVEVVGTAHNDRL